MYAYFTARARTNGDEQQVFKNIKQINKYLYVFVLSFEAWSSSSFERSYGSLA